MQLSEIGLQKRQASAFAKKNIFTTEDLVQYMPRAYHDYRTCRLVKSADQSRFGAFKGELIYCDKRLSKRWYIVMKIRQDDGTAVSVMLFSDTFRFKEYASMLHRQIVVCGKPYNDPSYGYGIKYVEKIIPADEFVPHIQPIYTKIKGVTDKTLEQCIEKSIEIQEDPLDGRLLSLTGMPNYSDSLKCIHMPKSEDDIRTGKRRILTNDMLYFAEALGKADERGTETTDILFTECKMMLSMTKTLPYTLTDDQKKVLNSFFKATKNGKRFNALIQGDVGCGKTIVAIAMSICACENGYQAAIMAPREVLAWQHYEEVKKYTEPLGLSCVFISSSTSAKEKKEILKKIASGEANIVVGTHSCIADAVKYHHLGLTVTDEEHLFGVRQKEMLEKKADEGVHAVSMSATPIPRSLATILYGNKKEIMSIHSMPSGRLPIKTAIQSSHENVFAFMEKQIREGHQCYVVCPAIEQNDEYGIVSIEEMEQAYHAYFDERDISIGIVNRQKSSEEVAETIGKYAAGDIDILMSTTVIEVGVNVPNATVMVIEQAERFGLASLHQLRGRVGRSSFQSYCILLTNDRNNERLKTMVRTNDGFEIAEADLKLRGSGDLLGVRQAGNNRFVTEMQKYPGIFQKAMELIKISHERGYTNDFSKAYGENAESVGEE